MPPFHNHKGEHSLKDVMPSFCDKCGTKFDHEDFDVISNEDNKAVSRIQCKECQNTFLMHIATPAPGVTSSVKTPFKTSLTSGEMRKFSGSGQISPDEELDIYSSLKGVKTISDFNKLFS